MRCFLLALSCFLCLLPGCGEDESFYVTTTVPKAGMLTTPEGRKIVAWFRSQWQGMPEDDVYFVESVWRTETTWPPQWRQLEAIYAPADPDDDRYLGMELKVTAVSMRGEPLHIGVGDYIPPLPIPRSRVSPTIEAWRFQEMPHALDELEEARMPFAPQEPAVVPRP